MNTTRSILAVLSVLVFCGHAHGDDDANPVITDLCASGIEGSAIGTIGDTKTVRMNLFCIDTSRIAASAYIDSMPNISLTFSGGDKDFLILSQFPQTQTDRPGISATTSLTYVKLNIADLKKGIVHGYFVNGNVTFPEPIVGKVDQVFPPVGTLISKPLGLIDVIGVYDFKIPAGAHGVAGTFDDAEMWVDVNPGGPIFNLFIKVPLPNRVRKQDAITTYGGRAIHFVDGPPWDPKNGFYVTTAFGDTSTTGVPLWHIRGRVVDVGTIEFYLIDPVNGIRGPITATRTNDPYKYLIDGPDDGSSTQTEVKPTAPHNF
jgi:hypothetical protein